MAPIHALKAIDKLLKDLMNNDVLFGRKVFVMGGDFRQIPSVVTKGNRVKIVESSIKNFIDENFDIFNLKVNMRADRDQIQFAKWLLKVVNGLKDLSEDLLQIPLQCIVKNDLIDDLYNNIKSIEDFRNICFLSTKNVFVDEINKEVLNRKLPGNIVNKYR